MSENISYHRIGKIKCALHQIDDFKKFMEVDVKPVSTTEEEVIAALFKSATLPPSTTIQQTLGIGRDRYKIDFSGSSSAVMAAALKLPFKNYMSLYGTYIPPNHYKHGWRSRLAQKGTDNALKKAKHLEWRNSANPLLGGRTPDQILARGFGPVEIPRVGFVWVGIVSTGGSRSVVEIQTYPFSGDKNFDNSIRWFMQRGTSLNQALRLNSQHTEVLYQQALIGSIEVLLGALKTMPGRSAPLSVLRRTLKTADQVNKSLGAIKSIISKTEAAEKLANSRVGIEGKVQTLKRVPPVAIPVL
ncbi:MAG: hypothetical protein ABJN34_11135 [Litoreibacter sp.]|uniref:hypothetical protein n=1 Tax=Litoreibacter sp. TaxID=1969459 RepID=UPI0032999C29